MYMTKKITLFFSSFAKIVFSLLCGGLFYFAWMAVFLLLFRSSGIFTKTIMWLSAPVVTSAGFASGTAIFERFFQKKKIKFFQIWLWPFIGCAVGAGAVFLFGPMLIVFGMFTAGTVSILIREIFSSVNSSD